MTISRQYLPEFLYAGNLRNQPQNTYLRWRLQREVNLFYDLRRQACR